MDASVHIWAEGTGWSPNLPTLTPGGSDRTLLLVFSGPEHLAAEGGPVAELARFAAGTATFTGCSTAGQFAGEDLHNQPVCAVLRFDHTRVRIASVPVDGDSSAAGRALASQLAAPDLAVVLVLSDGLAVNGTELAAGLTEVLGDVPVSGGLAADGDRFESTSVIVDGAPRSGWISGIGCYGDRLSLGFGSEGGWVSFGVERRVTSSEGSQLYELDGRPALPLYRQYLGDRAEELPAAALLFPLAVRGADGRTVVRTVLSVDDATQSLRFAGDIPQGAQASLMRASTDWLLEGAYRAAATARQQPAETFALAVSCVGRRLVLGQRTDEELEAARWALSPGAVLAGFYSYGELSPAGGVCSLHNQTMTITTMAER